MFKVSAGHGFQITFPNKWMVSVMFGTHNYCENRYSRHYSDPEPQEMSCKDAEIAILRPEMDEKGDMVNVWVSWPCDDVRGWVEATEVAEVIMIARLLEFNEQPGINLANWRERTAWIAERTARMVKKEEQFLIELEAAQALPSG